MFATILFGTALILAALAYAQYAGQRNRLAGFTAIALVAIALRVSVGLLNATYGPFPGAEADAVQFETRGEWIARQLAFGGADWYPWSYIYSYANVLAVVYHLGSTQEVLISLFNGLIFVLALGNLLFVARQLGLTDDRIRVVLLIVALYPAGLLYSSVPLREAPIVFALTLYVRGLASAQHWSEWRNWRVIVGAALGFFLHPGLLILWPLSLFVPVLRRANIEGEARSRRYRKLAVTMLVMVAISAVVIGRTIDLTTVPKFARYFSAEGAFDPQLIADVQAAKARGQGAYALHIPSTGNTALDLVLVTPEAVVRLMFSPYPWEVAGYGSFRELFKLGDVLLHVLGLGLALVAAWRHRAVEHRSALIPVLALYLFLAAGFGLASGNDGIAMRHRAKFFWMLPLVGLATPRRQWGDRSPVHVPAND